MAAILASVHIYVYTQYTISECIINYILTKETFRRFTAEQASDSPVNMY